MEKRKKQIRGGKGKSDFIYVLRLKACHKGTDGIYHKRGGRFISVLPDIRKECSRFKAHIRPHNLNWQELWRTPEDRSPYSEEHIYWGYECPVPSEERDSIIWKLDSQKRQQDAASRQARIDKTIKALDNLKSKGGQAKAKNQKADRKGFR